MGKIPPPLPLSTDEIRKRVAAGARTLAEVDPVFGAWLTRSRRFRLVAWIAIQCAVLLLIVAMLAVFVLRWLR